MFKAISNWLEAKQDAIRTEEYDNGYSYAALQILKYDSFPEDSYVDVTIFDRGIRDAARTIAMLQDKAKKLEKVEQENVALREIVRKMQTELKELLEQIPVQAPADATLVGAKLPFKSEDLSEWVNWVAQDADGSWYAYEKKPYADLDRDSWAEDSPNGGIEKVGNTGPNPNWKDTLCRLT